jgi:hypothetical protein
LELLGLIHSKYGKVLQKEAAKLKEIYLQILKKESDSKDPKNQLICSTFLGLNYVIQDKDEGEEEFKKLLYHYMCISLEQSGTFSI